MGTAALDGSSLMELQSHKYLLQGLHHFCLLKRDCPKSSIQPILLLLSSKGSNCRYQSFIASNFYVPIYNFEAIHLQSSVIKVWIEICLFPIVFIQIECLKFESNQSNVKMFELIVSVFADTNVLEDSERTIGMGNSIQTCERCLTICGPYFHQSSLECCRGGETFFCGILIGSPNVCRAYAGHNCRQSTFSAHYESR